ncbi:MAG: hydrogenase maturation protease [Nitrososphaerales archaeon]|jgi:hydrogenase 3 maturation protease
MRLVVEGRRGARREDYGGRVGWKGERSTASPDDLLAQLRECILGGSGTTHVFGIGNPIKQDDAVGLEVVSSLRRRLGPASRKTVRVHGLSSNPERMISDLASKGERIVIVDAVEAQKKPGTIVCARLSETKFGFFATHNVPIRLVPGVAENAADTYIVGIQPDSVGVGEGLSDVVKGSSMKLVAMIANLVEETE